jgi:hypothetical protein
MSTKKFKTLGALVKKVTSDTDLEFLPTAELDAFFLTYQAYTTSAKLLREFIKRFERVARKGEQVAQLRILQVMAHWSSNHWWCFSVDEDLRVSMLQFVNEKLQTVSVATPLLKKLATQLTDTSRNKLFRRNLHRRISMAPSPILPASGLANLSLLNVDPIEIARQLTLIGKRFVLCAAGQSRSFSAAHLISFAAP